MAARGGPQGKAVQVEPIKPMLQAPGTELLKLKYDGPLSNFAFRFSLRRYSKGEELTLLGDEDDVGLGL